MYNNRLIAKLLERKEGLWGVIGGFIAIMLPYFWLYGKQKYIIVLLLVVIALLVLQVDTKKVFLIWLIYHFLIIGPFVIAFGFFSRPFKWLSDYVIVLLFLTTIVRKGKEGSKIVIPKFIIIFFVFIGWGIVSALVNRVPLVTSLLNLKDYIRFPILALVLVNMNIDTKFVSTILKYFIVIILIQVPVSIIQFMHYGMGDATCGTFGRNGTGELVFIMSLGAGIILSLYLFGTRRRFQMFLIPLLFLPILLGLANYGILLFPLALIYLGSFIAKKIRTTSMIIIMTAIVFIIFYSFSPLVRNVYRIFREQAISGFYSSQLSEAEGNIPGRLRSISIAKRWIDQKNLGWVTGYGFGITKQSYWSDASGNLWNKYAPRQTQLSITLMETGYIGLLIYFFFVLASFIYTKKIPLYEDNSLFNILKSSTETIIVLYIVGIIYNNVATLLYFNAIFWIFIGVLYNIYRKEQLVVIEK